LSAIKVELPGRVDGYESDGLVRVLGKGKTFIKMFHGLDTVRLDDIFFT
jgi:hypothetical protein